MSESNALLEVENLTKHFFEDDTLVDRLFQREPTAVRAVDGISFDITEGETLGLVGESGCGKSTTGEVVLRLQEATAGEVRFEGQNVFEMSGSELQSFRQNAQIVFQDPFSSLDPRMTIGDIVKQPLDVHDVGTKDERVERVSYLLERVGLSDDQLDRYPHEFSGGQRQRIGIARALALDPKFVVLDEPTSALDVSVQAQVLNLLSELQTEFELTYLLISHDLSVIRNVCDRVAVMYLGELVEIGRSDELFSEPKHPYTEALLNSVPRPNTDERHREREPISGDVPSPRDPPSGCRFRTRCPKIIPPSGTDLSQAQYREIMDFRQRVEEREVSIEPIDEEADQPHERIASLKDRLIDIDLPPAHDQRVEDAIEAMLYDDFEGASSLLADEYESVCERRSPVLFEASRPTACHLYPQPDDI